MNKLKIVSDSYTKDDLDKRLGSRLSKKVSGRIEELTDIALDTIEGVMTSQDIKEKRIMSESWLDRIGFTKKVEKPITSADGSGKVSDTAIASAIKASIEGVANMLNVKAAQTERAVSQNLSFLNKESSTFEDAEVQLPKTKIPKELIDSLQKE